MANELDVRAQRQRLDALYREMADEQLYELAARPENLTDVAQEALRSEMQSRKLESGAKLSMPLGDTPFGLDSSGVGSRVKIPEREPASGLRQSVVLMTFHDALAAGEACDHLEDAGIEVDVKDVAEASSGGGSFYGGPPVALQVVVKRIDQSQAIQILREKMGLFPLQEVEEADAAVDDGSVATLGAFGHRDDGDAVARILEDAGIWHRMVTNAEGSAETEDAYTLEVREIDLMKAGEVVEKAMDLGE